MIPNKFTNSRILILHLGNQTGSVLDKLGSLFDERRNNSGHKSDEEAENYQDGNASRQTYAAAFFTWQVSRDPIYGGIQGKT